MNSWITWRSKQLSIIATGETTLTVMAYKAYFPEVGHIRAYFHSCTGGWGVIGTFWRGTETQIHMGWLLAMPNKFSWYLQGSKF